MAIKRKYDRIMKKYMRIVNQVGEVEIKYL